MINLKILCLGKGYEKWLIKQDVLMVYNGNII